MTTEPSTYHRRLAEQKRSAIIEAATGLFLRSGYDGTSLAKIAEAADVSKATLFKQFPTKAALFDAIVTDYWKVEDERDLTPQPGDLRAGLRTIGTRYAALLTRPGMVALFRIVIAEAPRFPELGETQFKLGKEPFFDAVRRYLEAEGRAGTTQLDDPEMAATQFLGMIANYVFWPRMLLMTWSPSEAATARAVEEAVLTMQARYGAPTGAGDR
ncbi:TetR/AcrR family transcriptional regulator [Micromonospora thermarum]|uniref:TetR/AcrR family transcriptional regulator n=1 Tax=Micromonospora thermarum TaxID=2720024 RepID=A0ABX0ZI82_9ACTN|nr:TetR/AcrR family transcriptional regulator [Micromonospora thermarum]NJP35495.1 TetR/AcrR family transcriptional regulator [Micromonospora thermarum]